jgi:predicted CxxxxCH...CXXCH cytochrome family protein
MTRSLATILAVPLVLFAVQGARGASTCSDCHGMPPIDAVYRNVTTGAFRGNHQTHVAAGASGGGCVPCHSAAASYASAHRNGVIEMTANVNSSPATGLYSKGTFFNVTSVPVLGTCSNVNCHFEAATTAWGSAPLAFPAGCSSCHGAAPSTGSHPAATGSGKKHGDYYGTATGSCAKCHPDWSSAAKPFAHATSAGKRGLLISFPAPTAGGAYSGTVSYPAYLPSKAPARNGTCSGTYCHSDGNGGPPAVAAVWGGTLPADCTGCHGGNAASVRVIGTALHAQHVNNATVIGSNYGCAACHSTAVGAASDRTVTGLSVHAAGTKTVSFSGGGAWNATAKNCTATVCHSSGKATAPQPAAPSWAGAALGCNGCHGLSNATGTPDYASGGAAVALANSHAKHVASAADCDACHTNTTTTGTAIKAGSALHTNGAIDVSFNPAKAGVTATWTAGTKTCANVYCHGSTLTGGTAKSPVWGATLSGCGTCHGYPPVTTVHTGKTPTDCITCHPHVNATGTGFTDATKHLNSVVDASGGHSVPFYAHATPPFTSCTGCHNVSAAGTYPAAAGAAPSCRGCHTLADPTVTATGCTSCHGNPPTGTAHPNIAGTHAKHSALPGCAVCHSGAGAGSGAQHGPGNRGTNPAVDNVVFTAAQAGASAAWNSTAKSCSSTYCHSTVQGAGGTGVPTYITATWGGAALTCAGCHADMSAAAGTGSHPAHAVSTRGAYACSVCHSGAGTGSLHANGVIETVFTATGAGTVYSQGSGPAANGFGSCSASLCHGSGVPVWGGTLWSTTILCEKCHGSAATSPFYSNSFPTKVTASSDAKVGAHTNHLGASTAGHKYSSNTACAECHTVPGTVNDAGHIDTAGPAEVVFGALSKTGGLVPAYNSTARTCANTYCHGNSLDKPTTAVLSPVWNTPFLTGVASNDCGKCHGYPPATATHTGVTAAQCAGCHPHVNATGTGFTDPTKHINGVIDAAGGGGDCTSCHGAQQGTGTRRVVGVDTVLASHHIVSATPNQASCTVCHQQTTFGHMVAGDVAVGIYNEDTGAALTYDGTTATAANLENSCNSCHDANGASRLGVNALKPFTDSGDNTRPQFIGWSTGKQAHGANISCFNCHGNSAGVAGNTLNPKYNAHGSATAKMLQYPFNAADTMTTTTNFCYNCHGTTTTNGVTSPSIKAAVDLSTSIGHNSARCSDCHDQHSAKPGTHAVGPNSPIAPVLNGVPGRGAWPATSLAMATTWTGTGTLAVTYTAKPAATKEYEICFKCHAGSVPAPTGYTAGALRMTDLGLEFNPNNKSGHPVVASLNNYGGSAAPKPLLPNSMVAPWTTVGTQTMTCSDCHGATGTGAKGPHGSSVRWMLTGTSQAWPFTTTAGNGTSSGTPWSLSNYNTGTAPNKLFCLNCHVINATNGMHDAFISGGKHSSFGATARGTCVSCHIRIPHGGKTSRLLRLGTASVLGRYAPDGNGAEVGTTTQQTLSKYTKGTQTSNPRGSFSALGCSEHTGGTETW